MTMTRATSIEEILSVLESKDARFDSNTYSNISIPFPVSPQEYLTFAEADLKDPPPRGTVNALSNAKRSLDARVDSVLIAFCLLKTARAKHWNVPKKLEQISQLGVITPRVLTKLNRTRNLIEHEFHKPSQEQVEDFVDIVALFHEATRIYLHSVPNDAQIVDEATHKWAGINLDHESENVSLNGGDFTLKPGDLYFERAIRAYARLLRNWYNE
jgi:hypothetical protein